MYHPGRKPVTFKVPTMWIIWSIFSNRKCFLKKTKHNQNDLETIENLKKNNNVSNNIKYHCAPDGKSVMVLRDKIKHRRVQLTEKLFSKKSKFFSFQRKLMFWKKQRELRKIFQIKWKSGGKSASYNNIRHEQIRAVLY